MDSISPEQRELKPPPKVVQLDQEFQLFNPSRTEPGVQSDKSPFHSRVALDTKELLPSMLNFRLGLLRTDLDLRTSIYPFNPEKGYTITNEDFDLKEREKKDKELYNEIQRQSALGESLEFTARCLNSPLQTTDPDYLAFRPESFYDPELYDPETLKFKPNVKKIIERLRLHLIFPNVQLQGLPQVFEGGDLKFDVFFPLDSGPLAHNPSQTTIHDNLFTGVPVLFPNDPKYIEKVQGIFVLDPRAR